MKLTSFRICRSILILLLWIPLVPSSSVLADGQVTATPQELAPRERETVIQALVDTVRRDYIDDVGAERIAEVLGRNLSAGTYDELKTADELAARLTRDLLDVTDDLHFHVLLDGDWVAAERRKDVPEVAAARRSRELEQDRRNNFGFKEIRRLEGNVGYLNLTYFADPETAHDTVAAAMELLAHRDAVILDLRHNNGGYLEMAQLLCSYFLATVPSQLLFDFYDLENGERLERRQWVLPSVSGTRRPDVPLYLLTSSTSFSAAEWFAFILKNLGRATVIGETTAGGAHPVQRRVLNDRFVLQVPTGEAKDGVLGEDFEGRGVAPHVEAASADALHVAHARALEDLTRIHPDSADRYAWFEPVIRARASAQGLGSTPPADVAGYYDGRRVVLRDGALFYGWDGEAKIPLHVLEDDLLALDGIDDFRFRIVRDDGKVTALERVFMDGGRRLHPKDPGTAP